MKKVKYTGKGQVERLVKQHEKLGGPKGIFGAKAKKHDASIGVVAVQVLKILKEKYPFLKFRKRAYISKKEINEKLKSLDKRLGKVLFVEKSNIKPDGGIIEVMDKRKKWIIILVSESKHQGNDIEKIKAGIKQGKNKEQDLMVAGNAIERVHKNILEVKNLMMDEQHFPYLVFLQGTNFAIKTHFVKTPDGRKVKIPHNLGSLNRIDRVTASNYSMGINNNYCKNIKINGNRLQVTSFYSQCTPWPKRTMLKIMLEIASTSLEILSNNSTITVPD